MPYITVCTPTYNRARTLSRVYESLKKQTIKDFEWIVIDDGSTDNTLEVVNGFISESDFPIHYYHQENSGKHVGVNKGANLAKGELFIELDSDDAIVETALEKIIKTWESIPLEKRGEYKGIIARCYNPDTNEELGKFPEYMFDSDDLKASFIQKFKFEKWNIVTTKVMREIPFPEPTEFLKFYPESVIWWRMARKYKTRYLDEPLRAYYRDQNDSLIKKFNNTSNETYYLWLAYVNEISDYFKYAPKAFIKAYIGFTRDSLLSKRKFFGELKRINNFHSKLYVLLLSPIGLVCLLKKKSDLKKTKDKK